jgi:uncharacterized repeat protein (TIGR01451 family)
MGGSGKARRTRRRAVALVGVAAAVALGVLAGVLHVGTASADQAGSHSITLASGTTPTTFSVEPSGPSGTAALEGPPFSPAGAVCNTAYGLLPSTKWIGVTAACAANAGTNQTTDYDVTFSLPTGFTNGAISVSVLADNQAIVLLNGTEIGRQDACGTSGCSSAHDLQNFNGTKSWTFTSTALVAGTNTLRFQVVDKGVVSGLDYSATVTYDLGPDLAVTKDDAATDVTPGTNDTYTVTVTNNGPGDVTGAVVDDSFPLALTGVTWTCAASAGSSCPASGSGNIHELVNLLEGGKATFTATGSIPSSQPAGSLANTASVSAPEGVNDPNDGNDSATDTDTITPKADLELVSNSASPATIYANATVAQNTIAFTLTAKNNGPSDAQNVVLTDDLPGLVNADYCQVTNVNDCSAGPFTTYPASGIPVGTVTAGSSVVYVLRAHANPALRNGALSKTDTATVSSSTVDPGPKANSATSAYTIDTVPGQPQNVSAFAGNGNAILSFDAPANTGGLPLDATIPYRITVNPGGTTLDILPTSGASCSGGASLCYTVNGLTNGTNYTFSVQARNAVGLGDPSATATAKPSEDNQAAIVPPNTQQDLTTCQHATATNPVCVQIFVPSGGGGVFSLFDAFTLPANFCGGSACAGNVGPLSTGPPAGYNNPKNPILEVVTMDKTIAKQGLKTKVYYQSPNVNGGNPFQLKFCKPFKGASPDPCLALLLKLEWPFVPLVDDNDVRAFILFTSDADPKVGFH